MPRSGGFGTAYLATAIINAATSTVNSSLARKQQNELAIKNQEFTERMEHNRQDFQLQLSEENAQMQREMSRTNHEMRLIEQKHNFELMCQSSEWQHFEAEWPLWVRPMVLRSEQILDDNSVALRVLFSKSNNSIFSTYIFPEIEQGLVEFVDRYHNIFKSNHVIFYHNAFKDNYYGGSFNANVHYALKELPVLIIDSNVLNDEICVSATMWGFGNAAEQHSTLFKLPYKWNVSEDGKIDKKYIKALTNQLLAYLKFAIGYAYDTYNLVMYNESPLLPKIAAFELEQGIESTPLRYNGIKNILGVQYGEIYESVLGVSSESGECFAEKPESFKRTVLHELRLNYAISTRQYCKEEEYLNILDESVSAWAQLRSDHSTEEFLEGICSNQDLIRKYCSQNDKEYFKSLNQAYDDGAKSSKYGVCCNKIAVALESMDLSTSLNLPNPYTISEKSEMVNSIFIDL